MEIPCDIEPMLDLYVAKSSVRVLFEDQLKSGNFEVLVSKKSKTIQGK